MSNNQTFKKIAKIIDRLESHGFIKSIDRASVFYDEPRIHKYIALLRFQKKYSDGYPAKKIILGIGFSFESDVLALTRCLGEALERLSLYCYKNSSLTRANKNLEFKTMNLSHYKNNDDANVKKLNWVKGINLDTKQSVLLPAQIVYLNYRQRHREKPLTTNISTGATGGFSRQDALLRGIYEVVERDCFMTTYLNKIEVPKIDLQSLNNTTVKKIDSYFSRYNLELSVFDVSNDLEIPCFMAVVVDRTGIGPTFTLGLKCSLNPYSAIVGSIEEAISARNYPRKQVTHNKTVDFHIDPKKIKTIENRALYWLDPRLIDRLDFLLKNKKTKFRMKIFPDNSIEELELVKKLLKNKNLQIYAVDISMDIFKETGYFVYKVVIPGLQPVYLDETQKEFNTTRLQTVAQFFGRKQYIINEIPHPLL